MSQLVLEPTSTAQWRQLVDEAQDSLTTRLDEESESYLVFLLMRFAREPRALAHIMALEYLESQLRRGAERREKLRDVGDQCLLFSGLFPHVARRRHVRISYYVSLGQGAYAELAHVATHGAGAMYAQLSRVFVGMMDVLHAMRRLGSASITLDPIEAFDLWNDTGSRAALQCLQARTSGVPVAATRPNTRRTTN